jgi:ABC-type dipeptide/oligopeptide/nickel transport system permease component
VRNLRALRYVLKRLAFVIPQLLGIIAISFILLKLIPGDSAMMMLGPMASEESLGKLRQELALDKSLPEQLVIYVGKVVQGDFGKSWRTTRPVSEDLSKRFPATVELVTLSLFFAFAIGIPFGVTAAILKSSFANKASTVYGLFAGALPDFWLGLVLIYVFYTLLGWAAAPMGRLELGYLPPPAYTGFYLFDAAVTGDLELLKNVASKLLLPVLTLTIIASGPIIKMTQSTMDRILESDHIRYARSCGHSEFTLARRAFRNAAPSILTVVSVLYSFLVGGAVLVEIVFSWGGGGQYALAGVLNSDINPVMGFVVWSAILSLIIYFIVDVLYLVIDPRIER